MILRYSRVMSILRVCLWAFTFANTFQTTFLRKFGKPPSYDSVPETSFSCNGRHGGYYADMEAQCQAYHMCHGKRQYSYLCPKYTLFNQKFMVCDHFVAVDCSASERYYHLNLNIGKEKKKSKSKKENKKIKKSSQLNRNSINSIPERRSININPFSKKNLLDNKISETSKSTFSFPRKPSISHTTPKSVKTNTHRSVFNKQKLGLPTTPKTLFRPNKPSNPIRKFSSINHPFSSINDRTSFSNRPGNKKFGSFTIDGRGKKVRFKVSKNKNGNIHKLRPVLVRKKKTFVDNRNFTISPNILNSTPTSFDSSEEHIVLSTPSPRTFPPLSEILIPPPLVQPEKTVPVVPRILVPPSITPIVLHAENQEVLSSISKAKDSRPRNLSLGRSSSGIFTGRSRGHRDFFIPAPGLVPPLPDNDITHSIIHPIVPDSGMTMTFMDRSGSTRTFLFPVNPNCPKCHPAFLRPNQCRPCVIIK